MRRLILTNFQSPGDIVMLTAAVRDLHRCHPGEFVTDVRTSCPALWEHNPYLTPLDEHDPDVEIIACEYPLIHRSNQEPVHFLRAFPAFLNARLGTGIHVTDFRGDIHISEQEKQWFSLVEGTQRRNTPFWLLASGGKFDYTIKWWDHARYQQVVDHFRGDIEFVLVGERHHHHPPLDGVVDLRGMTNLRQLVRLMYHADEAISAVSLLMHLAAAVDVRPSEPSSAATTGLLEVEDRAARRRRRKGSARQSAPVHGHDYGRRGHPTRGRVLRGRRVEMARNAPQNIAALGLISELTSRAQNRWREDRKKHDRG